MHRPRSSPSQATAALVELLGPTRSLFHSITQPGGGEFFRSNGLLFLPAEDAEKIAKQLGQAEPLIAAACDRSEPARPGRSRCKWA